MDVWPDLIAIEIMVFDHHEEPGHLIESRPEHPHEPIADICPEIITAIQPLFHQLVMKMDSKLKNHTLG